MAINLIDFQVIKVQKGIYESILISFEKNLLMGEKSVFLSIFNYEENNI